MGGEEKRNVATLPVIQKKPSGNAVESAATALPFRGLFFRKDRNGVRVPTKNNNNNNKKGNAAHVLRV